MFIKNVIDIDVVIVTKDVMNVIDKTNLDK